ncbi:MAG TPA: AAA family ATPase [Terriglobales bacterium]|nr:AAA family ATPase [Terriglobales bacterium]
MYAKHFGLEELPFSVTPDPRFSYSNSLYREAFATLRYGIESRKGFVVITGEAGTGKTTLLRRLMRTVEATVHTAFIFNTHLDFTELLQLVLTDLGIAHSALDRLTLMARLNDYLIEQLHKDHIVSVLVDEAQDLSDEMLEELRLLSNLETDRAKLIQIVLMGQPELERKLDQPKLRQLKQRVAVRCRLAPLGGDEVAPYILSRLQTVGYRGKELFDQDPVQKIALYSKGIPRLINVICDNALLIAYATSQSKVSAKIIDEVARDLRLLEPPSPNRKSPSRPARHDDEPWPSDAEEFSEALEPPSEIRPKRSWAGVGVALAFAVIILAGTVLYSQQSGSLAALGVNIDDLVSVPWKNPSSTRTPEANRVAQLPMTHVQVATSQSAEFLAVNPTNNGVGGASHTDSRKPDNAESQNLSGEKAIRTVAETHNETQSDAKAKPKERSWSPRTLRVFDASFVRDKPRSDAKITGMLEPGTRIRVQSKTGDYFRVRSLDRDREPISGYVHREDAFFEPAK